MKIGLPEVLKYLRHEHNLTQKELAKETGLSLSSIVSYENGLREPNSKAMAVLERYFNVSGEYLRGELSKDNFYKKNASTNNELDRVTVLFQAYSDAFSFANQNKQELSAKVLGETLHFLTKSVLLDTEPITTGKMYLYLLSYFSHLNSTGRSELVKRAEELTQIRKYSINDMKTSKSTVVRSSDICDNTIMLNLPVMGRSAAGRPIEMVSIPEEPVTINGEPRVRAGDFIVIAVGDSMIEAGIHDGDQCVIRPQDQVENGEITLVAVDDGSTIKRFYQDDQGIHLKPCNPAHPTQHYDVDAPIRVLGRFITVVK